jgi:putative flippase GtrA
MAADDGAGPSGSSPDLSRARHLGGFLISGIVGFGVDSLSLEAGIRFLALDPRLARIGAIGLAMVATWLMHRRFTFAVAGRPTLGEFGRFASAALSVAAANYSIFFAILSARPDIAPQVALLVATGVSTILSYVALRYGVFRTPN